MEDGRKRDLKSYVELSELLAVTKKTDRNGGLYRAIQKQYLGLGQNNWPHENFMKDHPSEILTSMSSTYVHTLLSIKSKIKPGYN